MIARAGSIPQVKLKNKKAGIIIAARANSFDWKLSLDAGDACRGV